MDFHRLVVYNIFHNGNAEKILKWATSLKCGLKFFFYILGFDCALNIPQINYVTDRK